MAKKVQNSSIQADFNEKTSFISEIELEHVKEIYVDSARMLKRIQAAPQGRAHRIRKRSNHVTLIIDKG